MKAYRTVLVVSLIVLAVAVVLPLITLREFEGYVQAWIAFLVIIAPAFLLVLLLILSRRLPPRSTRNLAVALMAIIGIGWLAGRVNTLFFALFLAGALAIILSTQRSASPNPPSAAAVPPVHHI